MVAALLDRLGVNPALYQQGNQPDIDGGLIGGAALKAADFLAIIHAAPLTLALKHI